MSYGWSVEQTEFLRKHYGRKGPTWVSERIGKSKATTYKKACSLGISFGDVPGFVPASEVATVAGTSVSNIMQAARTAGTLKVVGGKHRGANGKRALVRMRWADEYLAAREERSENETAGYLTTREVMSALRIGFGTLQRTTQGRGYLAELMAGVRRVRGERGRHLFNPFDVERVRGVLEADRARARAMVSVKSLCADTGRSQQSVWAWIEARDCEKHKTLLGGRVQTFVPRGVAAEFLGEFGLGRAA